MLGAGIRSERLRRGLSLAELARATGLTASALSQVENDLKEPSLSSLRRIAKALDVPMFRFLADGPGSGIVVRRNRRKILAFPDSSMVWEDLTPDSSGSVEMFTITLNAGESSRPEPQAHDGDECLLLLSGDLQVQVEDETHELSEGDSIYIHRGLRHLIRNLGTEKATVVTAMSPPRF